MWEAGHEALTFIVLPDTTFYTADELIGAAATVAPWTAHMTILPPSAHRPALFVLGRRLNRDSMGSLGAYFYPCYHARTGFRMLAVAVASVLLLVSGVWWTAAILLSLYWDRRFETPGRHSQRLQERKKGRDRVSSIVGAIMFSVPSVVTIGLALDGLTEARVIFYAPGWSWSLPEAAAFQLLGAVFVFVALPVFTSTVYLIERHVYARLPSERVLIQRGPYAHIRHPMHLAAFLLGIGWVLLAQNFAALVLLILLEGVSIAKKEEAELIETYGDAYRAYQRRTGFFLPRWRKAAGNESGSRTPRL